MPQSVDPALKNIGKQRGLEIWRIKVCLLSIFLYFLFIINKHQHSIIQKKKKKSIIINNSSTICIFFFFFLYQINLTNKSQIIYD